MESELLNEHQERLYDMIKIDIARVVASRWMSFRLGVGGDIVNTICICFLAFATVIPGVSVSMVGYMIVMVWQISDLLGWGEYHDV
jgi:hypothetical protein